MRNKHIVTVKITKQPESKMSWYYDNVGETFEVYLYGGDYYIMEQWRPDYIGSGKFIRPVDCEVVETEDKDEVIKAGTEVHADTQRLVREIDVIMNGKDAAEQASLCDLGGQIKDIVDENKMYQVLVKGLNEKLASCEELVKLLRANTELKTQLITILETQLNEKTP